MNLDWVVAAYPKAVPDLTIYEPVEQTQAIAQELNAQKASNDQEGSIDRSVVSNVSGGFVLGLARR